MRAVDLIEKTRDGQELSTEEIEFLVLGFTRGAIPDYQMSAWMMAVVCRGLSERETVDLTMTMARSGQVLDLLGTAPFVVDKHSTGGVGDKTTLVVGPLVASLGIPVGKMSGRGLSFTGGTLDKLESIPGFDVNVSRDRFLELIREQGIVVAGQSDDLAPADGMMYALRDATGTVPSLPLIASSIMSKKIAAGATGIVLDVKTGSGAFMKTEDEAVALADIMVRIGRGVGRKVSAVISSMSQPLGLAIGNALEVREAIGTLTGCGPADFTEHCLVVAAEMLLLSGQYHTAEQARAALLESIDSGRAIGKFRQWVWSQGGDDRVVDDPQRLPEAKYLRVVVSPTDGYIARIDALTMGLAAMLLGAGREKKGDAIDPAVGIVLDKKVGERVEAGDALLTLHGNDEQRMDEAEQRVLSALEWSSTPVEPEPVIQRIIRQ